MICGFDILRLDHSPIKGPEGNIEYLIYLRKDAAQNDRVIKLDERSAEDLLDTEEFAIERSIHESICRLAARAATDMDKEE